MADSIALFSGNGHRRIICNWYGKFYDVLKKSIGWQQAATYIFVPSILLSLFLPVAAFSRNHWFILTAIILFGLIMGAQTVVRALLADMVLPQQRATAYGIYNVIYGLALFIGGSFLGLLYDIAPWTAIVAASVIQLIALIFLIIISWYPLQKIKE